MVLVYRKPMPAKTVLCGGKNRIIPVLRAIIIDKVITLYHRGIQLKLFLVAPEIYFDHRRLQNTIFLGECQQGKGNR